jgi:hypothetical protein
MSPPAANSHLTPPACCLLGSGVARLLWCGAASHHNAPLPRCLLERCCHGRALLYQLGRCTDSCPGHATPRLHPAAASALQNDRSGARGVWRCDHQPAAQAMSTTGPVGAGGRRAILVDLLDAPTAPFVLCKLPTDGQLRPTNARGQRCPARRGRLRIH